MAPQLLPNLSGLFMHFRNITQNRIKLLVYLNVMHIVQAFVWGGGVSQGGVGWGGVE